MIQPTVLGRKLPHQDWEGDDFTPGASGKYVTCCDTAAGRMVAFATNGRIDKDGKEYRSVLPSYPSGGITLVDAGYAIRKVANLTLVIPNGWGLSNVKTQLRYARGLMLTGYYNIIPRQYRYQANADFNHSMWASHRSEQTGNIRVWDPLNPDTSSYGRWYPESIIYNFLSSCNYQVGYVTLESLNA